MTWKYLKYLLRHKWLVWRAGRRLGVGRWQLLCHDLSKFSPAEFVAYRTWFTEYRRTPATRTAFHTAWLHHIHHNPHHWEHWVLHLVNGQVEVLRMPERYVREMVADWTAVGEVVGFGAPEWYQKNRDNLALHPQTRARVEVLLGVTAPLDDVMTVPSPRPREIGT